MRYAHLRWEIAKFFEPNLDQFTGTFIRVCNVVLSAADHANQLTRLCPRNAFDDDREKENEIEILTKQITRGFHKCQNAIKLIGQKARNSSTQQQRMAANIMSSLASTLQVHKSWATA